MLSGPEGLLHKHETQVCILALTIKKKKAVALHVLVTMLSCDGGGGRAVKVAWVFCLQAYLGLQSETLLHVNTAQSGRGGGH